MFQFPEFASYPYVFRIRYLIAILGNQRRLRRSVNGEWENGEWQQTIHYSLFTIHAPQAHQISQVS